MDGKDLKEALEATTEKGATRGGYEQLLRQKLALKDDVDLSSIDEDTLKALAGTDEAAIDKTAVENKDEEASEDPDNALGNALGLEDKEDIKAIGDMSDEDKDKLVAAIGNSEIKESVVWTVQCYNAMGASNTDLAIILKEHYGLKKDEVKEILRERNMLGSSESRLQEKFLNRVLEAAKKLNFESIHQVFEDDEPSATHISNSSTVQSEFVPAQPSLEKAPAKLKESEDIATSPALEEELEKAGQNFFKTKLELHVNPGNNALYAYGDLGWRTFNPEVRGKTQYSVSAWVNGGKLGAYHVHALHAYDDADYFWAYSYNLKDWFFKQNNTTERFHVQCATIDDVLKELDRRNNKVEPRMMYDSQKPGSKGPKIEESALTDTIEDAISHVKDAEKHNKDFDEYAVEQDLKGAEAKLWKARMIAR